MKQVYCVEIDNNPVALANTLRMMEKKIVNFESDWRLIVNTGGIDYGVFINVDVVRKEVEVCNQPDDGAGEDWLEDIFAALDEDEDEEDEE